MMTDIELEITNRKYYIYAQQVVSGDIISCNYVKLACKRFLSDLQRDDLVFKYKKVDKYIKFIALFKHFKGSANNKPFILEPWQQFIVANIIGWVWKGSGRRRYTQSYIEIPRKNGKTALMVALALIAAVDEPGGEILFAANTQDQARVAFELAQGFVEKFDPHQNHFKAYQNKITFKDNRSFIKVVSSDPKGLDGYNCNFGIVDEFHAATDTKVRDVIRSSQGQRENPHLATITTAGLNKICPCYELREMCIDILSDIKFDDSMFAIIYTLDNGDNWENPLVWPKANPNLNVTVSPQFLQEQITMGKNLPSAEVEKKVKHFDTWIDVSSIWLPDDVILNCFDKLVTKDMFTMDDIIYIGVDLASVSDLTAVAYMKVIQGETVQDDEFYFYLDYYLPSDTLRKPIFNMFREWFREGYGTMTEGNVTDYDYINNDIVKMSQQTNIYVIAYDRYNSTQWVLAAQELGFNLVPFGQNAPNYSPSISLFERLALTGKIHIAMNPITRYCINNVQLKEDAHGNRMPVKSDDTETAKRMAKIDGVIAMLEAMGYYLGMVRYNNTVDVWNK